MCTALTSRKRGKELHRVAPVQGYVRRRARAHRSFSDQYRAGRDHVVETVTISVAPADLEEQIGKVVGGHPLLGNTRGRACGGPVVDCDVVRTLVISWQLIGHMSYC